MRREIKFRKWHKELSDMTFWDGSKGSNNLFWHTLTEYPQMYHLMQFTGLKDKNGKEIYEGDIVKTPFVTSNTEFNNTYVYYREDIASFVKTTKGEKSGFVRLEVRINEVEVIGNIYENPELLTSKTSHNDNG